MINIILLFWRRQTARQKATFIIMGLLICFSLYKCIEDVFDTYESDNLKTLLLKSANEKLILANVKIDSLLNTQIVVTKDIQKKSKGITEKLKQDVKEINNSTVTDKQLYELLAKYD